MKLAIASALFSLVLALSAQAQWVQLPGKGSHQCLGVYAANGYIVTATQDSNILRSTDQGATWAPSNIGIVDRLYTNMLYGELDDILLGSDKGGYHSLDGGLSWKKLKFDVMESGNVYAYLRYKSYIFATSDSGIFRSQDNGKTWRSVNFGIPASTAVLSIAGDNNNLYAGTDRQGILKSSDDGEHWESTGSGIPKFAVITSLWAQNGYLIAFHKTGFWARSTDAGITWKFYTSNFSQGVGVAFCIVSEANTILAGSAYGIIRSTDLGETWQSFRLDSSAYCVELSISDGNLYAATPEQWIWRRPLSEILPPSSVGPEASPYALRLQQSTPNPAVSVADISYALPSYSPITLKLYNAMMQEVATVVDEPQEAGEHRVTLDASTLPSGVYYYRLSAGTSSLMRRMVVVR